MPNIYLIIDVSVCTHKPTEPQSSLRAQFFSTLGSEHETDPKKRSIYP